MAACEPVVIEDEKHFVDYNFGNITTAVTEFSATVETDIPYITIDGEKDDSATFYLGYREFRSELLYSDETCVEQYSVVDGRVVFELQPLEPDTKYIAHIYLTSPNAEAQSSEDIVFTTKVYNPELGVSCSVDVDAKGVMAEVELSDVAYLVDGESVSIDSVCFEYAPKDASEQSWVAIMVDGDELVNEATSFVIPEATGDYLRENSRYEYRVTITPADEEFSPITTDVQEFVTNYADVKAEIAKPALTIDEAKLHVDIESVVIYYDGVVLPDYSNCSYYVGYRVANSEDWFTMIEAEATIGRISISMDLSTFEEGRQYEFVGAVIAGAKQEVYMSDISTIEIPKTETPTPPTPPIEGGDDTTALAGSWHLTSWRGAEPSFDVYLDITVDGVVTLWQRLDSREWKVYYSVVDYDNGVIVGQYSDGVAWGASYDVAIQGNTMTWVDTADSADVSVYTRCTLPDFELSGAIRSVESEVRFL